MRERDFHISGEPCDPPDGGAPREGLRWFLVTGYVMWQTVEAKDGKKRRKRTQLVPGLARSLRVRCEQVDGTWQCNGIVLDGADLGAALMRDLRLGELLTQVEELLAWATHTEPPRVTDPKRRSRRGRGDEFYEQLAQEYKDACDHPAPGYKRKPRKWLAEVYGVRPNTITDWLDTARRKEFLKRSPGKAGYLPLTEDPDRKEET